MTYTLHLKQQLPFAQAPALCSLRPDKIRLNDYGMPASIDASCAYNPHNVRAWVIGHEHGALCMVFASCEQNAMDAACDENMIDCLMSENQEWTEGCELTALGNADELFDLSYAWLAEVDWQAARDILLIVALAKASAEGVNHL